MKLYYICLNAYPYHPVTKDLMVDWVRNDDYAIMEFPGMKDAVNFASKKYNILEKEFGVGKYKSVVHLPTKDFMHDYIEENGTKYPISMKTITVEEGQMVKMTNGEEYFQVYNDDGVLTD